MKYTFQNTIEDETLDDLVDYLRNEEPIVDDFINEREEINSQPSNTAITNQTVAQTNHIFVADNGVYSCDIHAVIMVHDKVKYIEDVPDVVHIVDWSFEPNNLPALNQPRSAQEPQIDLEIEPNLSPEETPARHGQEPKNDLFRTTNKRRNESSVDERQKESFLQFY